MPAPACTLMVAMVWPKTSWRLAGDAQPFLDCAAAGLLLAGLGLAGKLGAGGHQQRPVVADRRAGSASGGPAAIHTAMPAVPAGSAAPKPRGSPPAR